MAILNNLHIFLVYIPFFISRVRPVHSFFKKKSILKNLMQISSADFLYFFKMREL